MSLRARIERLEQAVPPMGRINWENLYRRREDIVPDGIIDWYALHEPRPPWSPENCPIEQAIAAVARGGSLADRPNVPPESPRADK
jgi:hypothetical protein